MKYSGIFVIILTISCVSSREYKQVRFKAYHSNLEKQSRVTYKILIPKDYLEHRIFSGHGKEERFNYQDSIILCFSNDKGSGTLNFKNISDSGLSEKKFTFLANEKKSFSPLILNGKDEQGLFWKEYIEGDVRIGYINVPESKRKIFDKAIQSINCK